MRVTYYPGATWFQVLDMPKRILDFFKALHKLSDDVVADKGGLTFKQREAFLAFVNSLPKELKETLKGG